MSRVIGDHEFSTANVVVFQFIFGGANYVAAVRIADNVVVNSLPLTGANATLVILSGLAALTGGRTWYEKVIVKGNYVDLGQILLPSYTDVSVSGYWKARNALNVDFVINSGNTFIRICGDGTIDGNGVNQGADVDTICLSGCTYCDVLDLTVWGSARVAVTNGETVELENCSNCSVLNLKCFLYPQSYDHIKLTGTTNGCVVADNICIATVTGLGSSAIQLASTSVNNVVANNVIKAVGGNGIKIHNGQLNVIIGNTIYGTPVDGIVLVASASENFIIGNFVFGSFHATWGGITVRTAGTATDNVIAENYVRMRDGVNCIGITLDVNSLRTRVVRNTIIGGTGAADVGISIIAGATDNIIIDNDLTSTAIETKVVDAGTGTIFQRNKGYTGDLDGFEALLGGCGASTLNTAGLVEYFPINGIGTPVSAANEADRLVMVARSFTAKNFAIRLNVAPGGVASRTFVLRVNSAPTALTVTLVGGTTYALDNNPAHNVALVAGQTLGVYSDGGVGVPAASRAQAYVELWYDDGS